MRVVSLLPSAAEIVYALGMDGHPVGATFECDEPAGRVDRALDHLGCTVDVDEALQVLPHLPAVPVRAVDADRLVVRPGPRLVDGVEAPAAVLHPDRVGPPDPAAARIVRRCAGP